MRLTQKQRREACKKKLVAATIQTLLERGYAGTSISEICKRAGVSHGGLFRHYASRLALIAETIETIGDAYVDVIKDEADAQPAVADAVIEIARAASRSDMNIALREILVAARTDEELRDMIQDPVARLRAMIDREASQLVTDAGGDSRQASAVAFAILHMFEGESIWRHVRPRPEMEEVRFQWIADVVRREVGDLRRSRDTRVAALPERTVPTSRSQQFHFDNNPRPADTVPTSRKNETFATSTAPETGMRPSIPESGEHVFSDSE